MRVAVLLVGYQSGRVISACLESMARAVDGVILSRVVLVDNDSRDDTVEAATTAWPGLTVIHAGGNLGYAAAINLGRRAAGDHDGLLVLNPDTTLLPGAVATLARPLRDRRCGIAVPRMTAPGGSLSHSLRRWPSVRTVWAEAILGGTIAARLGLGEVIVDPRTYANPSAIAWATGAAVLVSRPCSDALGDWDESFFLFSEETEYMLRARDAGFDVCYVPDAGCRHIGGDSGTSPGLWALLVSNKVRLFRRSHGLAHTVAFRAGLLVGEGIRGLAGSSDARAAARCLAHRLSDVVTASDVVGVS